MKKRMKLENCYWIETSDLSDINLKSTARKIMDESKPHLEAQEWPTRGTTKLLPSALDHHRDCDCNRFALPTEIQSQQDECLDLRVPWRKTLKEERNQESPDSSVQNVEGKT